jgi:hypothetical protein
MEGANHLDKNTKGQTASDIINSFDEEKAQS